MSPPEARQCGRAGLSTTCSHRQKSRASTRVASSQTTPTAHKNRNQRSNAIPYDRCVVAGRPPADNSAKNADTAATGTPAASSKRNGANRSPVDRSDPPRGTTNRDNSRAALLDDHGLGT